MVSPPDVLEMLEELPASELYAWATGSTSKADVPYSDDSFHEFMMRAHDAHHICHRQWSAANELGDTESAESYGEVALQLETDIQVTKLMRGAMRLCEQQDSRQSVGENCFS
jgi:hypothetical protein